MSDEFYEADDLELTDEELAYLEALEAEEDELVELTDEEVALLIQAGEIEFIEPDEPEDPAEIA